MIRHIPPSDLLSQPFFSSLSPFLQQRLGPDSKWLRRGRMMHFVHEPSGARASAFVNPSMQDQAEPTGVVGCLDIANDEAALKETLAAALEWLRSQGMKRVRGPIDFATWHQYRAITQDWGHPPILGENAYDARYAKIFDSMMPRAGTYCSTLVTDIEGGHKIARMMRIDEAGEKYGITVDVIPPDQIEPNLQMFYDLAMRIFPLDWAFSPIEYDEFVEQLLPVARHAPDFQCLVAREPGGLPVGLCYGYLNPTSAKKCGVVKTVGVTPEYQGKKISYLLTYRYHIQALERGYQAFLHAMMKEDNVSRGMSMHFASKIRGYAIWEGGL